MGHGRRFYYPYDLLGPEFVIGDEEATHALKVLRVREGERISLVDGKGSELPCVVTATNLKEIKASPCSGILKREPPRLKPVLLLGVSDPKAVEEALLHSTELGLWRMALVSVARSPFSMDYFIHREERLVKIAISGIKQSGNPYLPAISFYNSLEDALSEMPSKGFLFEQGAPRFSSCRDLSGEIVLAIGPEGDFSDDEKAFMTVKGFDRVSMAENTLRVETAALAATAQLIALEAL